MHLKGLYDCKDRFCTQINFVSKTLSSLHTCVVILHDFLLYADFSGEINFSKSLFLGGDIGNQCRPTSDAGYAGSDQGLHFLLTECSVKILIKMNNST